MPRTRILIVDDEICSTRLLKANLELTNLYEVQVENWPEQALATARQFKPHLVLLDLVMPGMSGTHVAKALLADPELKFIPIVLLTAAETSLLPEEGDPSIDRLPRIAKPAGMRKILHSLAINLSRPPAPGLTPLVGSPQTAGGRHE